MTFHTDCDYLFSEFQFASLTNVNPPKEKGVYIIRVQKSGEPIEEIITNIQYLTLKINWPIVGDQISNRIERILNIKNCPYLCLGFLRSNRYSLSMGTL